jgi:hypothetical protein
MPWPRTWRRRRAELSRNTGRAGSSERRPAPRVSRDGSTPRRRDGAPYSSPPARGRVRVAPRSASDGDREATCDSDDLPSPVRDETGPTFLRRSPRVRPAHPRYELRELTWNRGSGSSSRSASSSCWLPSSAGPEGAAGGGSWFGARVAGPDGADGDTRVTIPASRSVPRRPGGSRVAARGALLRGIESRHWGGPCARLPGPPCARRVPERCATTTVRQPAHGGG